MGTKEPEIRRSDKCIHVLHVSESTKACVEKKKISIKVKLLIQLLYLNESQGLFMTQYIVDISVTESVLTYQRSEVLMKS